MPARLPTNLLPGHLDTDPASNKRCSRNDGRLKIDWGETLVKHGAWRFALGMAVTFIAFAAAVRAQQEQSPTAQKPSPSVLTQEETKQSPLAPCVEPAPVVSLADYDGPLKKTVGVFARKLERKTVHHAHFKPGAKLCSLELKDKFVLFVQDSVDPVTFVVTAFNAGLDQAGDVDPTFGQGPSGYGLRFGANFVDQASFKFFKDFAYPSIFAEDPRYYRVRHGEDRKHRLFHAMAHTFVAHRDNGTRMFNFSEWLGTITAVTLSNAYHPGHERGVAPLAQSISLSITEDMGFDILREFWPEISRKFKLPFRGESSP